jgi:Tfp pilus assembly protein PilW
MRTTPPSPISPASEHGLSLIELLVAMLSAAVVIGALVALLTITLTQESRITDRVQADQLGRTAMTNIVEQLHSSCTGFSGGPIQKPESAVSLPLEATGRTSLWFISLYGENSDSGKESSAAASPGVAIEHDIRWAETGKSNTGRRLGTLTDYEFKIEGTSPRWSFPSELTASHAARTKTLATDVIPPEISKKATVFQYYKYQTGELTELQASELEPTLSKATAEDIAKVTISFEQAPTSANTQKGRTAAFSDSVVLREDPTESTTAEGKPCE